MLSTTGATIVPDDGTEFTQERLGPLCFFGNQLVLADNTGLQMYEL